MSEFTHEDVVALTKQVIANDIPTEYTKRDAQEALRQTLIDINGGPKLTRNTFRQGTEIYTILEKVLTTVRNEGLDGNGFWDNMVESIKVDLGDKNEFITPEDSLFIVSEIGRGNQAARRQRFQAGTAYTVPTHLRISRVYEHMDRVLAGRIDFNTFIDRVSKSFAADTLNNIYVMFSSINATTDGIYPAVFQTGTYDEDTLLNIIDHVEADTGQRAMIIGSRPAVRNLKIDSDYISNTAKDDMYNMGYVGKFNGTPVTLVSQRNKVGTHDFIFPQDRIYIIASDDKPIKHVEEGDVMFGNREFWDNSDMTQEYVCIDRAGDALVIAQTIGCYIITK